MCTWEPAHWCPRCAQDKGVPRVCTSYKDSEPQLCYPVSPSRHGKRPAKVYRLWEQQPDSLFVKCVYCKRVTEEFLMWRDGVSGILGALGSRVNPWSAQWVRDPVPTQPQLRLLLWLRYDPWPGNSICHEAAKKKKEKPMAL